MPIYKKKTVFSVDMGAPGIFVFTTNQEMSGGLAGTGIGVTAVATTAPAKGYCGGFPKPPRITVSDTAGGRKSTFCAPGTSKSKGDIRYSKKALRTVHLATSGSKVVTCYVETGGIKRAWNMPLSQHQLISADFTKLGISAATKADANELVWGCEAPYPAKVKKFDPVGTAGGDLYTTFASDTKYDEAGTGWAPISTPLSLSRFLGLA